MDLKQLIWEVNMASSKIDKIKDILIVNAQASKEFVNLPPAAKTAINQAIEAQAGLFSGDMIRSSDLNFNNVINKLPLDSLGGINPVNLSTGSLDVNSLKNSVLGNASTQNIKNQLSGKLTNKIVGEINERIPNRLRDVVNQAGVLEGLAVGVNSAINKGIDSIAGDFANDLFSKKVSFPTSVPNIGSIFSKSGSEDGLKAVNEKFNEKFARDAIEKAKKFDINNPGNEEKLQVVNEGFKDPKAKFPLKSYKNHTGGDTNKLATGDIANTIVIKKLKERVTGVQLPNNETFDQPTIPYGAKYPHNKVIQTESGHIIEMDDTPGSERLHIYSGGTNGGTFIEIDANGTIVKKTKGASYEFVEYDDHLSVTGDSKISIGGKMKVFIGQDADIEVEGDVNLKCFNDITAEAAGKINLSAIEEVNIASANINMQANAFFNFKTEGNVNIHAKENINQTANSNINLQVDKDFNLKTTEDIFLNSGSNFNLKSTLSHHIQADQFINFKAGKSIDGDATENIRLNAGNNVELNNGTDFAVAAETAGDAVFATNANIQPLTDDRKDVVFETRNNPTIDNFTASEEIESEDPDSGVDPEETNRKLVEKGIIKQSDLDKTPVQIRTVIASSKITTVVPADGARLLIKSKVPDNYELSPNFTLADLSTRGKVSKFKLEAQANLSYGQILFNLSLLALNVLEPIKLKFPEMFITSGFRLQLLNAKPSQHHKGQAVDIQMYNTNKFDFFDKAVEIEKMINYDQFIYEHQSANPDRNPWLHISFVGRENRKNAFTMDNHKVIGNNLIDLRS